MNLEAIARGYIQPVNQDVTGDVYFSAGPTRAADFKVTPTFTRVADVSLQVQAMTGEDLRKLDALNQQGVMRAVYVQGLVQGVNRFAQKGGDVLNFSGAWWLTTQVLEPWTDASGWTKIAVTLQNGVPPGITPP